MNTVCHIEFHTTDLDRAEAFYRGVFDWEFKAFVPQMRVFGAGETHIGGLVLVDEVKAGRSPSVWIDVESLEATLARVSAHGGTIETEREEIPGTGWSAGFADPDGNPVGIVQFS